MKINGNTIRVTQPPQWSKPAAGDGQTSPARTKRHADGNSNLKQERLTHQTAGQPGASKPTPAVPGTETEELQQQPDGSVGLVPEVAGAGTPKQWDPAMYIAPVPPKPRTLGEIFIDTFRNPGAALADSFTQIHHHLWNGREATKEEVDAARQIGSYFTAPIQMAVPGLGVAGAVASVADVAGKWQNGEKVDPNELADGVLGLGGRVSGTPSSPAPAAKPTFKPPTRQPDGRIGYPLSPKKAPRLPGEDASGTPPSGALRADAEPGSGASGSSPPPGDAPGPSSQGASGDAPGPSTQGASGGTPDAGIYINFAREEHYLRVQDNAEGQPQYVELPDRVVTDGYNSNYRGKGMEALVLHGSQRQPGEPGRVWYQSGRQVHLWETPETFLLPETFAFSQEVTPAQLVHYLKQDQGLDLVSSAVGGQGSSDPLYLLSCRATEGGSNSAAQGLADATGREVRAHSRYPQLVQEPDALASNAAGPRAYPAHPLRTLIRLRNQLRPRATHPDQLLHKKFVPSPGSQPALTPPGSPPPSPAAGAQPGAAGGTPGDTTPPADPSQDIGTLETRV